MSHARVPTESAPRSVEADVPPLPANPLARLVNSRTFALEYELAEVGADGVAKVELWGTRDGGQSWQILCDRRRQPQSVRRDRRRRRRIWFLDCRQRQPADRAVLRRNRVIRPHCGSTSTSSRRMRKFCPSNATRGDAEGELTVRWEADDDNLEPRPISLFYSSRPAGPWTTIATELENSGEFRWPLAAPRAAARSTSSSKPATPPATWPRFRRASRWWSSTSRPWRTGCGCRRSNEHNEPSSRYRPAPDGIYCWSGRALGRAPWPKRPARNRRSSPRRRFSPHRKNIRPVRSAPSIGDEAFLKREVIAALRRQVLGGDQDEFSLTTFAGRSGDSAPRRARCAGHRLALRQRAPAGDRRRGGRLRQRESGRAGRLRRQAAPQRRAGARREDLAQHDAACQGRRREWTHDRVQVAQRTANQTLARRASEVEVRNAARRRGRRCALGAAAAGAWHSRARALQAEPARREAGRDRRAARVGATSAAGGREPPGTWSTPRPTVARPKRSSNSAA